MSTASVAPIPSVPVYGDSGGTSRDGGNMVASRPLPPIGSTPEPYPYQNASPTPMVRKAAYAGPSVSPRHAYQSDASSNGEAREVRVRRGQTLFSLSREYGVTVPEIVAANGMTSASLREGQTIRIPDSASTPQSRMTAGTHRVETGDTLYGIARQHGISHRQLAAHNDISLDAAIRSGQVLKIPAGGTAPLVHKAVVRNDTPAARKVKTVAITPPRAATPKSDRPGGNGVVLAKAVDTPGAVSKAEPIQKNAALPEPEPMTGNSFRWPVKGRIISEFGTKPNGSHNDGINVAVPEGTSVKAAENGVVAYAGDELKGYGNLILIRHANNWVSAYAHNEDILVKRGDKVRRGQIIAEAGKTGSVSQPQLHFELRKGSRPVDPTKYMKDA